MATGCLWLPWHLAVFVVSLAAGLRLWAVEHVVVAVVWPAGMPAAAVLAQSLACSLGMQPATAGKHTKHTTLELTPL